MLPLQEDLGNFLNPLRDSGGKHETLELWRASTFDRVHNLFDVLLEAKVEHLISLVKNGKSKTSEVKVSTLHVINDSTAGSDEDVDTTSKLVGLLIDVSATIDCQDIEFTLVVPEGVKFFGDLESKLSGRGQDHG